MRKLRLKTMILKSRNNMYILTIFSVDREIEGFKTRGTSKNTLNFLQFKRNPKSIALKLKKI